MSDPLRVCVDFEAAGDPIAGTVTSGAERRPFTGWLGLIAGLQNAIGAGNDGDGAGAATARRPAPDRRDEEGEV